MIDNLNNASPQELIAIASLAIRENFDQLSQEVHNKVPLLESARKQGTEFYQQNYQTVPANDQRFKTIQDGVNLNAIDPVDESRSLPKPNTGDSLDSVRDKATEVVKYIDRISQSLGQKYGVVEAAINNRDLTTAILQLNRQQELALYPELVQQLIPLCRQLFVDNPDNISALLQHGRELDTLTNLIEAFKSNSTLNPIFSELQPYVHLGRGAKIAQEIISAQDKYKTIGIIEEKNAQLFKKLTILNYDEKQSLPTPFDNNAINTWLQGLRYHQDIDRFLDYGLNGPEAVGRYYLMLMKSPDFTSRLPSQLRDEIRLQAAGFVMENLIDGSPVLGQEKRRNDLFSNILYEAIQRYPTASNPVGDIIDQTYQSFINGLLKGKTVIAHEFQSVYQLLQPVQKTVEAPSTPTQPTAVATSENPLPVQDNTVAPESTPATPETSTQESADRTEKNYIYEFVRKNITQSRIPDATVNLGNFLKPDNRPCYSRKQLLFLNSLIKKPDIPTSLKSLYQMELDAMMDYNNSQGIPFESLK